MKLVKIEHPTKGIWYFTNPYKASEYIGTGSTYFTNRMKQGKTAKKWSAEWIESDEIMSKYINPERQTAEDDLKKLNKVLEAYIESNVKGY